MSDGIPELFQTIFYEHYPTVLRRIKQLVHQQNAAEDLAQEVFIRLYRNPPNDLNCVGAWLHRVLTNLAYDYLKSQAKQNHLIQQIYDEQTLKQVSMPALDQLLLTHWQNEKVRTVLAGLSERDRTALVLKHSGYSYSEIAGILQVNPDIVGSLLSRAAKRFKRKYQEEGDWTDGPFEAEFSR